VGNSLLIVFGPFDESLDGSQQRSAQVRESVFDARRNFGVHAPVDQAVALEVAQSHGQHASADPVDLSSKFAESKGLLVQQRDHQKGPLVGDTIENLPDATVLAGIPLVRVTAIAATSVGHLVTSLRGTD